MSKIRFEAPIQKEWATFDVLQQVLSQLITLIYHVPNRVLWTDFDASKKFSFGAVTFHTTKGVLSKGK